MNQLQNSFKQLSIRSSLTDKYRQLISHTNTESLTKSFVTECYLFLQNYGCLLDRHTYRSIKETFLYEIERNDKRVIQSSTKIIQLIKLTLDLRLKQRNQLSSTISNDVFKKLHLEPSEDISTAHIYRKHRSLATKSSSRLSSDFLTPASSYKSIHQDEPHPVPNPLMKCYYRHINEQIDSILKRYSRLSESEQSSTSLVASEGKALVVAGHKLIFVLETLHEHLQQIQTPLISLTTQLRQSLTTTIQLLKQLSQQNCTNMAMPLLRRFQQDIQMIIDIVKRIKHNCSLS